MHASSASQPEAQETDKKRRVAAQGAARRTRVRGCSPCQQYPDAQLPSLRSEASPPGSCAQLDAAWTPAPHRFPSGPSALSATYWGSARAARRGRGPGRGPASERLQRAGDPTREKARGAATTFQVRADRSSRRRAAQGGLGTWAPHWVGAGRRGEGRGRGGAAPPLPRARDPRRECLSRPRAKVRGRRCPAPRLCMARARARAHVVLSWPAWVGVGLKGRAWQGGKCPRSLAEPNLRVVSEGSCK